MNRRSARDLASEKSGIRWKTHSRIVQVKGHLLKVSASFDEPFIDFNNHLRLLSSAA
jgi:hypothetical protein